MAVIDIKPLNVEKTWKPVVKLRGIKKKKRNVKEAAKLLIQI